MLLVSQNQENRTLSGEYEVYWNSLIRLYLHRVENLKNMERENTIRQVGINDIVDASEKINAGITYTDKDIIVIEHLEDMTERGSIKLSKDMIMIMACLEGKMHINLNGKFYTLHPHEVLICRPNIILYDHENISYFKGNAVCLSTRIVQNILHNGSDIWNKFLLFSQNPVICIGEDCQQLFSLYSEIIRLRLKLPQRPYHKEIMTAFVKAAIYELLADLDHNTVESIPTSMKQGDILFKKFIEILVNSEIKQRTLNYYADRLFVTSKYLSTVSKQVSGRTAMDWINEYVVDDIQHLLTHTDKSIKEISEYLEFSNISFFGKYVKSHLGCSPKEFRKQLGYKK